MRLAYVALLLLLRSEALTSASAATQRYTSGDFPPWPNCDSNYNTPCSISNAYAVVNRMVATLGSLSTESDVQVLIASLQNGSYDTGVDGIGFGPMVISWDGVILADTANSRLLGKNLSDVLNLYSDGCRDIPEQMNCLRVEMTVLQEDLLDRWKVAAADDGWAVWMWTDYDSEVNVYGTLVPEKKFGYVRNVTTMAGDLLVVSSYVDRRFPSPYAEDPSCVEFYNGACSLELARMLVGDATTKAMMAETPGQLQQVFNDFTFDSAIGRAGTGFYVFIFRYDDTPDLFRDGPCMSHKHSRFLGMNISEFCTYVGNAACDGESMHERFSDAAKNGGGWVTYWWQNRVGESPFMKMSFIAGFEKFGQKYYAGTGFALVHPDIATGPHCTGCSSGYSYVCALRNTAFLIGHVQSFMLSDATEFGVWQALTTSWNSDPDTDVTFNGTAEESGYKFGGVNDPDAFYAFVFDFDGTCKAHGNDAAYVGRTWPEILEYAGVNTDCDADGLNCGYTGIDGEQLHEDLKGAAAADTNWVSFPWMDAAGETQYEKMAYVVKISKYGHEFYAGVWYNNIKWDPESARDCSAQYAGTCSEDNVMAIVGHLATAISVAQDETELSSVFADATNSTGTDYRRDGGFFVEVYDEDGMCMAHGGTPGFVGMTVSDIFMELGSKLLTPDQYKLDFQTVGYGLGDWFNFNWQTSAMPTPETRKAWTQKATFTDRSSRLARSFYIVTSFIDAEAPPRCGTDSECPAAGRCGTDGYCFCQAGTVAAFDINEASCVSGDTCSCATADYLTTCEVNPCSPGQFGNVEGVCQDCDPGKFAANSSSSTCSSCPPGKYQDSYGQTFCSSCAKGTSINAGGSTSCESCIEGWYQGSEGSSVCEKCDLGTYAPNSSTTACTSCPFDHETTSERSAVSSAECICSAGYFREAGHSMGTHQECRSCPEGMECEAGNGEPVLLPGFWAREADSEVRDYSVYRCRNEKECPGGVAGTCASGREGIGCANCLPSHQKDSRTGNCDACEAGSSVLPTIIVLFGGMAGFLCMAAYSKVDVSKVHLNTLAVGICIGQTAVAVQALSVFRVMDVDWVEPFNTFLNVLQVFAFDLEVFKFSCMYADSNAAGLYLLKNLIFPSGIVVLCCIFVLMKKVLKHDVSIDNVVNSIGLLFLLLFLTLAMLGLNPFHCVTSPNGTKSMFSNPSVICFEDAQWWWLAAQGLFSIMFYCVGVVAWVLYITFRYPRMVASGHGMLIMNRYRFLFQRFTVERYFYTPIYLARNFFIAVLPVSFADDSHRQIFFMAFIFSAFGFLQSWLKPWRGFIPNAMDLMTTICLIMALLAAALLLEVERGDVLGDVQVFFAIIMATVMASVFGFIGYLAFRRLLPGKAFGAFLCHAKADCSAGARLMKLELEPLLKAPVFLDSDELDNLEDLLDIVRTSIKTLVVLLTSKTLTRPWCAGEIATAFRNGVPIVGVAYDDYEELTEEDLSKEAIADRWPADDFTACVVQGVDLESVKDAFAHLSQLKKIQCWRVAAAVDPEHMSAVDVATMLTAACLNGGKVADCTEPDRPAKRMSSFVSKMSRTSSSVGTSVAQLAVLAAHTDPEAISTALVISTMARRSQQWQTFELFHPKDVEIVRKAEVKPKQVAILLTEGALTSEGFCKTLFAALDAWGDELSFVTVKSAGFNYPAKQVLIDSIIPQVSETLKVNEDRVAIVYKMLLNVLSVPFTPSARFAMQQMELSALVSRLQRAARNFSTSTSEDEDPEGFDNMKSITTQDTSPQTPMSETPALEL